MITLDDQIRPPRPVPAGQPQAPDVERAGDHA